MEEAWQGTGTVSLPSLEAENGKPECHSGLTLMALN